MPFAKKNAFLQARLNCIFRHEKRACLYRKTIRNKLRINYLETSKKVYRSIYKTAIYTIFRLIFMVMKNYDESIPEERIPKGEKEGDEM